METSGRDAENVVKASSITEQFMQIILFKGIMYSQKWRTYGGTNQLEKNNHVTFQSLVVHNFTLTNDYLGLFSIQGQLKVSDITNLNANLIVGGDQLNYGNLLVEGYSYFSQNVIMQQNLDVSSVVINDTLFVGGTFTIFKDILVGGNVYVKNNSLLLGYNSSSDPNNTNPHYAGQLNCNTKQSGGFMGINFPFNTPNLPGATLDVYSDSLQWSTITTALNVHSTGTKTQSIMSSNASQQGMIVYTDSSQCSLHMFHDTSYVSQNLMCDTDNEYFYQHALFMTDHAANTGDATVVYTPGGNLSISVENNVNFPSTMSIGTAAAAAGENIHTSLEETVSIFSDVSFALFPDYYTDIDFTIQHALSMVGNSGTSGSITGFNMMLSSGKGQCMMGGSYMYDSNRSMAISGLITDASWNWSPSQMTVSNSNPVYGKSVTAFNTYQPVLDSYVVTINGPTQITNGEIHLVQDVAFQIMNVISSPRNRSYVLSYGGINFYDPIQNYYHFPVNYSTNGGQTWNHGLITDDSKGYFTNMDSRNINMISSGCVYDDKYALIAMNHGGYILVSCDGLQTWKPLLLMSQQQTPFANGCTTVRILDVLANSANLVVFTDVSSNLYPLDTVDNYPNISWFSLPTHQGFVKSLNVLHANGNNTYNYYFNPDISYVYTSFPTNMKNVRALDGYDSSYIFAVGSGIQKYMVTSTDVQNRIVSAWHVNNIHYTYYAMQTYKTYANDTNTISRLQSDAYFSLFVGDGIITYTNNGGSTFTDVSLGFSDYLFTGVTIYDVTHAIVVGSSKSTGAGIVYTTYNGGVSWYNPYSTLNMSGMANLLTDGSLVSICQSNTDDFIIVRRDMPFTVYDISAGTFGQGQMFLCHVPSLFDRTAHVLDICGSVQISGSLLVDDNLNVGGRISCPITTIQSDYRIKSNITDLDDRFTVDHLRPVLYNNEITHCVDIGFLAHEVQKKYPFLVHGDKDDINAYQSLNYNGLIGILVKEIQDLKKQIQKPITKHALTS